MLSLSAVTVVPAVADVGADDRVAVADARPAWAVASAARGHADSGTRLNARVYLAGRDPRGLNAFVASVSDPKSRAYRHFLTPAQYRARFGPTDAQTTAVRSWLESAGLTVTGSNQHYVSVRGSVAQAEKAFGTTIDDYPDATAKGAIHYAPAGRVTVPASISSAVLGVTGLDNGSHRTRPLVANDGAVRNSATQRDDTLPGPPSAVLRAGPCSAYYGQNPAKDKPPTYGRTGVWTNCGYTPQQFRSAYRLSNDLTGAGQTVAIVDAYASPTIESDISTFTKNHGVANLKPGQFTQSLPSAWNSVSECGGNSWYVEESIDVTAVHDIAPDAKIAYVAAASCNVEDEQEALSRIVDNKLATIVTNSWNRDEESHTSQAERDAFEQIFKQGAAEGIGFYFSSGDCGADDPNTGCPVYTDGPYTEFPPSDPYVTAVGGTSLAVGSDGRQLWQTGWNNVASNLTPDGTAWTPEPGTGYPSTYLSGAGGGTSVLYPQPSYQANVVPESLSKTLPNGKPLTSPMRVVPDVAADADNNTGILAGSTQHFPDGTDRYHETRWGGTSLAAPLFAGIQAVTQQVIGAPFGFANPAIYAQHGTAAFDDVTDTPGGPNLLLGVVRNDYTNPSDPNSPLITRAQTFGHNGLTHATTGYDNVTGLGSPGAKYFTAYGSRP
ncbi:S53 family peptidase [Actinoallomurus sp. CA-142502]|uniref:S53 family peptidase n=1 Tax=Actinoallomurus sp. CA-142502 TaxID=3239885 RepID=UPI003D8F52B5